MFFKSKLAGRCEGALDIGAGRVGIEARTGRNRRAALPQMPPQHQVKIISRIVLFVCHCCFTL